jgi:hypothetical protein
VKKIALTIFVSMLIASLCVPALASDGSSVTTDVQIAPQGGQPPIIKCKWETPDDGDLTHTTPGTQILPPGAYQQKVPVCIWAIITDPQGTDTVAKAYADVYHPETPPECGSFKYQLPLYKVDRAAGRAAFDEAWENGLIILNPAITYDDIIHELTQGLCDIWMGQELLDYHQPAGDYRVEVTARDVKDNWSDPLINTFLYVPVTACEFDFEAVYYGSVDICYNKWIGGDTVFEDCGTSLFPTVRNIGNTNLRVTVWQDDLGLGTTSGEGWNVEFDARLGAAGTDVQYMPFPDPEVVLPDILPLCNTQKLDFSIHVIKGMSGTQYAGEMVLGCVGAEWIGDCGS